MEYSAAVTKHQGSSMDWCGLTEHAGKGGGGRERNAKEDLEYATSYEEEEQIRNNSFEKKTKNKNMGGKPKD